MATVSVRYIVNDVAKVLIDDPSGDPVELFQPTRPEATPAQA